MHGHKNKKLREKLHKNSIVLESASFCNIIFLQYQRLQFQNCISRTLVLFIYF